MTQEPKEWSNLLVDVFERLTSKHASITYEFNNMTFESEKSSEEAGGVVIPQGRVKINGKITITASQE